MALHALVIHLRQSFDEALEHSGGIGFPYLYELFLGHAANTSKVGERFAASRGGHLHFDQRLGQR